MTRTTQVPGEPKTQAEVTAEQRAGAVPFTPQVAAQSVKPTTDTASNTAPVKTTAPLRGTVEEQIASLMARQAETEEAMRQLKQRNADLEGQVRKSAAPAPEEVKRPTVKQAMADQADAKTSEERRPVLTNEGWYVHPKAYETPNADIEKLLRAIA